MATPAIFLVSRTENENHILRHRLEPLSQEFGPLRFLTAQPQGIAESLEPAVVQIIFNFNEWTPREADVLFGVRKTGYNRPMVVLAKEPVPNVVREIQTLENVVCMQKPFETRDLVGIASKFLCASHVDQQFHRRYNTIQEAVVHRNGSNEGTRSRLFNLSRGGAYLEFSGGSAVKVGEEIHLRLELKEVSRAYTMPAKVIWTQKASTTAGSYGVGIEFVGMGDVEKLMNGPF